MEIILNTRSLNYPLTGVGCYTKHLLRGLQAHNAINRVICISSVPSFPCDHSLKKRLFEERIKKIIRCCPGSYTFLRAYSDSFFYKKTRYFSSKNFIYHEPSYILKPYAGIKICNIHDLSHIYYPESHPRERVKFLLRYLPGSIEKAQHIITSSYVIRDEIVHYFKVSPKKITTIYHGVSQKFRPYALTKIIPVLVRYGLLGKSYLLSVGTLEPRKNLVNLILAFKQLPERERKQYPLVLVGAKGWGTHKIERLMKKLMIKEELYYLGYVLNEDLPYLYAGAYGFAYLSIYEGFGLPLLEALASGVPTLTSKVPSMLEVAGNAALFVDPYDIKAITENLKRLLTDHYLRHTLKKLGRIQRAKFSWETCINNTVKLYQRMLVSFS